MAKRWILVLACLGGAGLLLAVACSEQQRDRVLTALIDGYPEEGAESGEPAKPETAETEVAAAAPAEESGTVRRISANHAGFAADCDSCHGPDRRVAQDLCQECHDIGLHQDSEMDVGCGACHGEHRGQDADLAQMPADHCTDCHDQHPFEDEHPEFSLVADAGAARKAKYAAGLEVFHSIHAEDMECSDCHRSTGGQEPAFKPVTYADSCAGCHELDDHKPVPETSWPDLRAKLTTPDVAEAVLLSEARWQQKVEGLKDDPQLAVVEEVRETLADEGLEECFRCHSLMDKQADGKRVLAVAPARYRASWFGAVRFSHAAHAEMSCDDCHKVPEDPEEELGRLMLPGKEACAECHNADGASTACSTCHLFHDR
jgi:hypothetical protein